MKNINEYINDTLNEDVIDEEIEEMKKQLAAMTRLKNLFAGGVDILDNDNKELQEELNKLRNPWISVEERLPEEDKDVFVRKTCTNGIFHLTGKVLNGGKWYCYGFGWQDSGVITHWMPIQ